MGIQWKDPILLLRNGWITTFMVWRSILAFTGFKVILWESILMERSIIMMETITERLYGRDIHKIFRIVWMVRNMVVNYSNYMALNGANKWKDLLFAEMQYRILTKINGIDDDLIDVGQSICGISSILKPLELPLGRFLEKVVRNTPSIFPLLWLTRNRPVRFDWCTARQ